MIGYKAFKHDWTCNDFQYQLGQTYEMPENEIKLCEKGFHFCQWSSDVFQYYKDNDDVYAEIKAEGKIIQQNDKCVTSKITIVKQLSKQELIDRMPSVIHRLDGAKEWWHNGQIHRLDGPAIEYPNGTKQWWQNGLLLETDARYY